MENAGILTRLDTVIIRVSDMRKSRAWYEGKLGFTSNYVDDEAGLVVFGNDGTTSLTIWQLKKGEELPAKKSCGSFPIFLVQDAGQTREMIGNEDIRVSGIEEGKGVRWFQFYDPDGNVMECC